MQLIFKDKFTDKFFWDYWKKEVYRMVEIEKDTARVRCKSIIQIVEKVKLRPTLFTWKKDEKLHVLCTHVNDFFYGGREEFERKVMKELRKMMEEKEQFKYLCAEIRRKKG